MKRIIPIFLLFLLTGFNIDNPNGSSFEAGEWFQFRVHYGIFNASYATLELKNDYLDGKQTYHVIGQGRTTGLARLFYKVDDNYESYFDKENGKPYKFIRQIDEGGYTKDLEINFDHDTKKATIVDHKNNKQIVLNTHEGVQDLLSAFYYMRNRYNLEGLNAGDEFQIDMLYDDDGIFKFKLKYLGTETIRTKFGKIKCLRFRPYVQSGRVFKEQESLTLWVSKDANKIPIRIKADLAIGSLKADLNAFKGLKHQFKIEIE
ncbi:DUF3108 domain-containing protein [Leptobacterium sp. I13]|uniref:DUF3108 domain-containing protein n=1 Tax=Leptobacterium meishanense TaxID=3128904 RepID=UPI0030ED443F